MLDGDSAQAETNSPEQGLSAAAGPVGIGETIAGKYRVEQILGTGGMGVVVAARHIELDQKVAIKVLRRGVLGDTSLEARFLNEARALAKIESEHVVRVLDVGRFEASGPYIVMEHLVGKDLANVLKDAGSLPIEETVDYVLQACLGLADAHALGFIHRDLKPGNLFVCQRVDGTRIVKVIDFGIAKSLMSGGKLTSDSLVLGSPRYMSPEQLQSSKNVDVRTDIWALGVILYRLLSGRAPFAGNSTGEILAAVLSEPPQPIRELRHDVPHALAMAIERCLAKKPEQRFQTVGELATALAPFASPRFGDASARIAHVARVRGSNRPPPPDRSALEQVDTVAHIPPAHPSWPPPARPSWPPPSTSVPPNPPSFPTSPNPVRVGRSAALPILLVGIFLIGLLGLAGIAGVAYFFGGVDETTTFVGLPVTDPTRVDAQQAFPAVKQFVLARDAKAELVSIAVGDHVRGGLADLRRGDVITYEFVNRTTSAAVRVELETRGMRAVVAESSPRAAVVSQPACSTEAAWRVLTQGAALSNREASFKYGSSSGRAVWTIVIADSPPVTREIDGESCSVIR